MGEGGEVQGGGDERLAGAGGGVQDDVLPLEEGEDRFLLRGIEDELLGGNVVEETAEQLVAVGVSREGGSRREDRPFPPIVGQEGLDDGRRPIADRAGLESTAPSSSQEA